jgi:uncharacterized protein
MANEEKIDYKSGDGILLTGVFDSPEKIEEFALMAHGIGTDKNEWNNQHFKISKDLNEKNVGTFRFDYRGHGESQGTMREMTIMGEYLDIKSSADQIKKKWSGAISIIASSFGAGSAILYSSIFPENISSLILLNPVLDYNATFLNPLEDWGKESFNEVGYKNLKEKGYLLLDGIYQLDAKLIAEFACIKPYKVLNHLKCPVLTIHGDKDSMVPFQISKKYGRPNRRSKFVAVSKAEHGFIDWNDDEGTTSKSIENQNFVTEQIIKWIRKWGKR